MLKKRIPIVIICSVFALLFLLRSESHKEGRWIEASHVSSVNRLEPIKIRVKLGDIPANHFLMVDLHYKDGREFGYLTGVKPVPAKREGEYEFSLNLPSDYKGRSVFPVFYLSPSGSWNDRVLASYGQGIALGSASLKKRLWVFSLGENTFFNNQFYTPSFIEKGDRIKKPSNRGTTHGDRLLLFLSLVILLPLFIVKALKGDRIYFFLSFLLLTYVFLAGFDIFNFSANYLRRFIVKVGIYPYRRPFQFLVGILFLWWGGRKGKSLLRDKYFLTVGIISLLFMSSLMEMISFHYLDTLFYWGISQFTLIGLGRVGLLVLLAIIETFFSDPSKAESNCELWR